MNYQESLRPSVRAAVGYTQRRLPPAMGTGFYHFLAPVTNPRILTQPIRAENQPEKRELQPHACSPPHPWHQGPPLYGPPAMPLQTLSHPTNPWPPPCEAVLWLQKLPHTGSEEPRGGACRSHPPHPNQDYHRSSSL